jgi:hypothetical protein
MGDGQHMLPIKGETRKTIGKAVGQTVSVLMKSDSKSQGLVVCRLG